MATQPLFPLDLDAYSLADLETWQNQKEKILRYHWDLYSALAFERGKMGDQLRIALLDAGHKRFEFNGWQRQVRYQYALSPFSPKGSLIEPGGRFNVPNINPDQIPPFPALYMAEDKETTLQEAGQGAVKGPLSSLDLALIRKESIAIVAVKGSLGSLIDLHQPQSLKKFVDVIKNFTIPPRLIQDAKKIKIKPPTEIKNIMSLMKTLLEPNWRVMPMQFDIPANCQIFGQMAAHAGIEGILYPSKFTGKKCIAVFPHNFTPDSFVEVEGEFPPEAISRLDQQSWPSMKATF